MGDIEALDLSFQYFAEVKDHISGGDLSRTAQIRLGSLIAIRCIFGETTDCLGSGLQHLKDALADIDELKMANKAEEQQEIEDVQAVCFYNLVALYECRFE